jgi:hypothetical protein
MNYALVVYSFCIQYFGGGKTKLGFEFGTQLLKGVVDSRAHGERFDEMKTEWEIVREKGVRHVYCDVASEPDFVAKTLRVFFSSIQAYSSVEHAAIQLVEAASVSREPLLIHFDEVGSHERHDLKQLRAIWKRMWETKNRGHEMPIIFFLVTGRSIEYFETCGIGTKLLVLNMLETKHVTEVRRHLMSCPKPLVLSGLNDNVAPSLDKLVREMTGGAPRLLLRALHYLCKYKGVTLDSDANIDKAVTEAAYELLRGICDVLYELMVKHSPTRLPFSWLCRSMRRR